MGGWWRKIRDATPAQAVWVGVGMIWFVGSVRNPYAGWSFVMGVVWWASRRWYALVLPEPEADWDWDRVRRALADNDATGGEDDDSA